MPSSTTLKLSIYYCVYVLKSLKDNKRYVGFTTDLKRRLGEHIEGKVFSTRREKYLKTTGGRRFLAKRLKSYYKNN